MSAQIIVAPDNAYNNGVLFTHAQYKRLLKPTLRVQDHVSCTQLRYNGEYSPQMSHNLQGDMICSPAGRGTRLPMLQHGPDTSQPRGSSDAVVSCAMLGLSSLASSLSTLLAISTRDIRVPHFHGYMQCFPCMELAFYRLLSIHIMLVYTMGPDMNFFHGICHGNLKLRYEHMSRHKLILKEVLR